MINNKFNLKYSIQNLYEKPMNSDLSEKYSAIKQKILETCTVLGRPIPPRLVAVSKKHPVESIEALYRLGHRDFGENFLQELEQKRRSIDDSFDIFWHFIGQIQSNKIKKIVELSSFIHGLCQQKHALMINNYASELKTQPIKVFLSVNLNHESSKSGLNLDEVDDFYRDIKGYESIEVMGLMAIPSPSKQPIVFYKSRDSLMGSVPEEYVVLKEAAKSIGKGRLSLGMSADFQQAIAVGSNYLRLGTQIFGPRSVS